MMYPIRIILLLCFATTARAQSPEIKWAKCFGGSLNDFATEIIPLANNGFLIAGDAFSGDGDVKGNHGNKDIWLVACDSTGSISWQKCIGGSFFDEIGSIQQTGNNSYLIAGTSESYDGDIKENKGGADFWLGEVKNKGELIWQKSLGGSGQEGCRKAIKTADGGYLAVGYTFSNDGDVSGLHGPANWLADAWIVKVDTAGNVLWQKCFGGTDSDGAYDVVELPDESVVVLATCNSVDGDIVNTKGNRDVWLIKFNKTGNMVWKKNYGGKFDDIGYSIALTKDNGFIVCGNTTSNIVNGTNYPDAWFFCTDSKGQLRWQKKMGGTGNDNFTEVLPTGKGWLLTGHTNSKDGDVGGTTVYADYWLVQSDTSGNILWQKTMGGNFQDFGKSSIVPEDNSILVSGYITSGGGDIDCHKGNTDAWIAKLQHYCGAVVSPGPYGNALLDTALTDTCGKGSICIDYVLGKASDGAIGKAVLHLNIYQGDSLVTAIHSDTLTTDSAVYCFAVDAAVMGVDNSLGGFDYTVTSDFILKGCSYQLPVVTNFGTEGQVAGANNDYRISCDSVGSCAQYCFVDNYGYRWKLCVGKNGNKYSAAGTVNVNGILWETWGIINCNTGRFELHAVNPKADNCISGLVDSFVYRGYSITGCKPFKVNAGAATWKSYCGGNVAVSGIAGLANCGSFIKPSLNNSVPAKSNKQGMGIALKVSPNPVRNTATINYRLEKESKVIIAVDNSLMQPVTTMFSGTEYAGDQTLNWNIKSANGAVTGSGVYKIIVFADGRAYSTTVQLIK